MNPPFRIIIFSFCIIIICIICTIPQQANSLDGTPKYEEESTAENPESCQSIVSLIHGDTKRKIETTDQEIPWERLSWLQEKLGTDVKIIPQLQTLYQWEDYNLIIGANGAKDSGRFPGRKSLSVPTFEEATDVLGKPNNIEIEVLNKIAWMCPNKSQLEAITDDNGNVLLVSGINCLGVSSSEDSANCAKFSMLFKQSKLEEKAHINLEDVHTKQNDNPLMKDMMRDYNVRFKTNIQDASDLQNSIRERLINYYRDLKACKPGDYTYAIPMGNSLVFYKSSIQGLMNNQCVLETSYIAPDSTSNVIKCQYLNSSLRLFTDEYADALSHGNLDSFSPTLKEAQISQCKYFINGQEIKKDSPEIKLPSLY